VTTLHSVYALMPPTRKPEPAQYHSIENDIPGVTGETGDTLDFEIASKVMNVASMTPPVFRLARLTLEHMHGHLVVLRALLGEQHTMPDNAKDRARMRMAIGIIDSYGYNALVGVAHLFPDFIGGKNEESRQQCLKTRMVRT
jgi:hypothetical protein